MFDARTFPSSLEEAKSILASQNAVFKGDYAITDKIYCSKNRELTLDRVFLRLRLIPKNIWSDKSVIVAIKNTEIKSVGKQSIIPLKMEFDSELEAIDFINKNYSDQFDFLFQFNRTGEQYFLGDDGVDLEDIEGNLSIEFKSKTQDGLRNLLTLFNVKDSDVIKGPSVMAMRDLFTKI
jgi:hypothetical protein